MTWPDVVAARVQAYGDTIVDVLAQIETQLDALAGGAYVVTATEFGAFSRSGASWGVTATATLTAL